MAKLCLSLLAAALIAVWIGSIESVGLVAQEKEKSGEARPGPEAFRPVAPLLVLMENVDTVFIDLKEKIDKKELKSLKKDAQFLSELFNVAIYHKAEAPWREWSQKNLEQFKKLAADAERGDEKLLKAGYDAINATCDACHEKYRDA